MPKPLTDYEKGVFDAIKQGCRGARPEDIILWRMLHDGNDVAVIVQRVLDANTGAEVGHQPLAMVLDFAAVEHLSAIDGQRGEYVDPDGLEGPA